MTPYAETQYALPIPILPVLIGHPEDTPWLGPIESIVDTGADITLFPLEWVSRVHAPSVLDGRIRNVSGSYSTVTFFVVSLQIQDIRFSEVQIASADSIDEVILGRNVLNKLPLFLDGPKLQTEILDDATVKYLRERHK